jgi:hypothetical protein
VDAIRQLVDDSAPEVFAGLKAAPDVPAPPTSILISSTVNQHATQSTYRVEAPACGRVQEGTGFAVARDLLMTNAHVVAGSRDVSVFGENGEVLEAGVVAFDPAGHRGAAGAQRCRRLTLAEPRRPPRRVRPSGRRGSAALRRRDSAG